MAHRVLVWIDVDDEYCDVHPQITADDYLEGSKAYGWEVVTERVFTESDVRAMLMELKEENIAISGLRAIAKRHGIVLDPA